MKAESAAGGVRLNIEFLGNPEPQYLKGRLPMRRSATGPEGSTSKPGPRGCVCSRRACLWPTAPRSRWAAAPPAEEHRDGSGGVLCAERGVGRGGQGDGFPTTSTGQRPLAAWEELPEDELHNAPPAVGVPHGGPA